MPRTVETTVYQFDELSDKAKDKARAWYREASAGDNYFAESVIEDAVEIAALMGLNIKTRVQRWFNVSTKKEGQNVKPCVYWSGFSSQGDGASFEGTYYGKPDALEAVKAHAPTDTKLHDIISALQDAQSRYDHKINATITTHGNYSHAYTMRFEFELDEQDSERDIDGETVKAMEQAFRDYANWIYRNLESEYEYQNSDEQVDETIRANEYEFTAEGKRA